MHRSTVESGFSELAGEDGGAGGTRGVGGSAWRLEATRRSMAEVPAARSSDWSGLSALVAVAEAAGRQGERWRQWQSSSGAGLSHGCSGSAPGAVRSDGTGRSERQAVAEARTSPEKMTHAAELKKRTEALN